MYDLGMPVFLLPQMHTGMYTQLVGWILSSLSPTLGMVVFS